MHVLIRYDNPMISLFSPKVCKRICRLTTKWTNISFWFLLPVTLASVLLTPADMTQGDIFRMIYIHVPMAFASLSLFIVLTVMSSLSWIFHIKIAKHIASIAARIGVVCTLITLVTGAIWGFYTWGDWWVWDARLTSYLMLGLIYLAYIVMDQAVIEYKASEKSLVIISWVGLIDIVLVHYSVMWWQSLHQQSTLLNVTKNTMPWSMLAPLILSILCAACLIALRVSKSLAVKMDWGYE